MLIRLITVISLLTFMLLMISGAKIDVSLYRSCLVFLILFTLVYIAIFLLNVVRGNSESEALAAAKNNAQPKNEN